MLLYVCQHPDYIGDDCMSVSTQRVLVMLLYVCQHADDDGDACIYQQMEDIHDVCIFISIQMILVLPASVYEQSTADSFGRYIAHPIFGNSDRGRLLNPMFCTKQPGTIGYQLLISSTKN
jgi:hypothetical protein